MPRYSGGYGKLDKKDNLNFRSLERGRHHVVRREYFEYEGIHRIWPVVYLVIPKLDRSIEASRIEPILVYFTEHSARSYRWMKNLARAFGLLIDYAEAVCSSPKFGEWKTLGNLERVLLRGFAHALLHGTAKFEDGRWQDWTELYWFPLGRRQANVLLSSLTLFFKWLRDEPWARDWVLAVSTESAARDPAVAMRLASELLIRRGASLLGHLKTRHREPAHAFQGILGQTHADAASVPTFPAHYVADMLYKGFVNRRGHCDETAQLIAHLIFLLGLRKSEAFHLFTTDVRFIKGMPWIFFHHPEWGKIRTPTGELIFRSSYLRNFGLIPRNRAEGISKAGWKGMADDDAGAPGYFLPIEALVTRTAHLLRRYILITRPSLMSLRRNSSIDHPFLFVSSGRTAATSGSQIGDPYTMSAFENAWEQAVRRIGRLHDDPAMAGMRKRLGTTPHGGRHFYGRFLFSIGLEGSIIQRCMHHRTLNAHSVYTRLTPSEINELARDASQNSTEHYSDQQRRERFFSQFQKYPFG